MQNFSEDQIIGTQAERLDRTGDEQGMMAADREYLLRHPLSINKAGREELEALGMLTPMQIGQLLAYRNRLGYLIDKYELQAIPGWDLNTIRSILPYITIDDMWVDLRGATDQGVGTFSHRILIRMGSEQLFFPERTSVQYAGDLNRVLLRYQYQTKQIRFGCTAAKDAGEAWRSAKPLAILDFRSFHFQMTPGGVFQKVVAGDFTVQLGQGLIQWQRLSFGKSGELTAIKRQGEALQPYRSSGTFYFYRGAGITLGHRQNQWTFFFSSRKLDAHLLQDSSGMRSPVVTSIVRSGYHRTDLENQQRGVLGLRTIGGQWKHRWGNGHIALNAVHHHFQYSLEPGEEPYEKYYLRGRSLTNLSIDHSITYRNLHWFSEWATRAFRSTAWCTGLLVTLHQRLDAAFLVRDWAPSYQAFFANGFGEGSTVTNEKGIFTALVFRPTASMRIEWMADLYCHPWLRYKQSQPVCGQEQMIKWVYAFNRQIKMYFQYRVKTSDGFTSIPGSPLQRAVTQRMSQLRMQVEGRVDNNWELRLRLESVLNKSAGHNYYGFLGFLDLGKNFNHSGINCLFRLQYCATDDYTSRIYAYEPDVQYAGSTRFFYGEAFRWVFNASIPIFRSMKGSYFPKMQFWMRISRNHQISVFHNPLFINDSSSIYPLEAQAQLQLQF